METWRTVAECSFHLFERHHSKSRIFERMENLQNDCCRPWTKNLLKNSNWMFLRIVNACGCVDRQQVRSSDRNLFFFRPKLLIFMRWWQLWMKSTTIKQRYRMNLFLVVFRSFVLLPNSVSNFIHNRNTCKLIIKTTAAYMHTNNCACACFYVLVRYFVVLDIYL